MFVSGGSMKLSGGLSSGRSRVEARSAGGPGVSPLEIFEIWDAIWYSPVHFGKKLTVLQFYTIVNENIAIMLDCGIDIVAYYFNF